MKIVDSPRRQEKHRGSTPAERRVRHCLNLRIGRNLHFNAIHPQEASGLTATIGRMQTPGDRNDMSPLVAAPK